MQLVPVFQFIRKLILEMDADIDLGQTSRLTKCECMIIVGMHCVKFV